MPSAILLLLFSAPACSQAPAASTQTAVAVSSGAPEAQGSGLKVGGEQPAGVLKNPISVKIHKESKDWEPVSLRVGGDPGQTGNSFMSRVRTVTVKDQKIAKGNPSKTTAVARVHPHKDDKLLIIAVYPAALKKRGVYMEVRFLISEGYLDEMKVAAVTVRPDARFKWGAEDTFTLAKKGMEFSEDFPAEGKLTVSALNPKPGKGARNSGRVSGADFGGRDYDKNALRVVNFSFSASGVSR